MYLSADIVAVFITGLTWTCLPTETADKHFPKTEQRVVRSAGAGRKHVFGRQRRPITHPGSLGTSAGDPVATSS